MISRISGTVVSKRENKLVIDVRGICYEVIVPETVFLTINENNTKIELITYHYLQSDPSRSVPVLIGFINEIEKEFFEQFIKVSGIGPKAAIRAFTMPVSQIARAIDNGDVNFLKRLPGIGEQRAREVIAKLQGKIGKYGLIKDELSNAEKSSDINIREEALAILMQLQYKRAEAQTMIEKAFLRAPEAASAEEILNEVYRQKVETK
ncbi:MAG: Holliday junction branch migration protein RuvA [Candidatus Omnitrophota bacterium]